MEKRRSYAAPRFPEYFLALKPSRAERAQVEAARNALALDPQPVEAYPILFPYEGVWCLPVGRFRLYYFFNPDEITVLTIGL